MELRPVHQIRKAALIAALALGLVAPATAAERVLRIRLPSEPRQLDWSRAGSVAEGFVIGNLVEGLVSVDASLKAVPALAESWTVSPDRRTYLFTLRAGVKWSDGVPLRAQDFVFSWKRLLSPATASTYGGLLHDIDGAAFFTKGTLTDFSAVGVRALDERHLQVTLTRPIAHWLLITAYWPTAPLREDVLEKFGEGWSKPGAMVSIGPFVLQTHDYDQKLILRANPNYYGKKGNIDSVTALIVTDSSTALNLYEADKLDVVIGVGAIDRARLARTAEYREFPAYRTAYLGFASTKYPASSPQVRRAIAMAIDRSKLSSIPGGGPPARSFVPPPLLGSGEAGLPFDPVRARKELAAAGMDSLKPIEMLINDSDVASRIGQYIQSELKKNLGLTVNLAPFESKSYYTQAGLRAHPLYWATWTADYPDPDSFLSLFLAAGGGNSSTGWTNAEYDKIVEVTRGIEDPKERARQALEAQRILLERDVAIIPLYYDTSTAMVKTRVRGLSINPMGLLKLGDVVLQ